MQHLLDPDFKYQDRVKSWALKKLKENNHNPDALWSLALLGVLQNRPENAARWFTQLEALDAKENWAIIRALSGKLNCDLGQSSIHIDGLPFSHTDVLVSLDKLDGDNESYVLRPDNPSLNLKEESPSSLTYFIIGIEHLVFGIDHVLFVIGLFLFIREPIALIKTITAFTVSHSITLALSVLELVKLDQGPVEAVIALSIFFSSKFCPFRINLI